VNEFYHNFFSLSLIQTQYLKTYTNYCSKHEASLAFLSELKNNPEFTKAINVCLTDKRVKGQNLQSYLVKPVQRICKVFFILFFKTKIITSFFIMLNFIYFSKTVPPFLQRAFKAHTTNTSRLQKFGICF